MSRRSLRRELFAICALPLATCPLLPAPCLEGIMTHEEWLANVPDSIKNDRLWEFTAYQKALLLYDLMWEDCEKMLPDVRGRGNADQLNRSVGSISANIEEGYGRGFGKEYDYFLRVALGSARESRGWYYRSRRFLSSAVLPHRYALLDEIIGLLVNKVQARKKLESVKQ
ncbi:four helix bundle protein [candidate division KSB1 bacterium]|nr:MAG: four helix bundle protein [candidate division KSB1 bacterium]MBC6949907.1 four helix bundle protein [candidate division KSB1 bacterium]MCE7944672.1 four helix bundle protein [Chlorobi bacterium CHB1]